MRMPSRSSASSARITSTSPQSTTRVASSIVTRITSSARRRPRGPTISSRTVSMIAITQSWATLARTGMKRRRQRDDEGEEDRELAVRRAGRMRERGDVRAHQDQHQAEGEARQPRPRQR